MIGETIKSHPCGTMVKHSKKLTFLAPIPDTLIRLRTCGYQGEERLVFRRIWGRPLLDDPLGVLWEMLNEVT